MKVIIVAPGFRLKHQYFYYSFYKMLLAGFYRTENYTFFMSDRDVADSFAMGMRALGKGYARRYLIEACDKLQPQVLVSCHADIIDAKTYSTIRDRHNTRVCMVDCDYIDVTAQHASALRLSRLKEVIDAAFITTGGDRLRRVREIFPHTYYVPNPLDPGTFDQNANQERPHDLVYVASSRQRVDHLLKAVESADMSVVTGGGKKNAALYGFNFENFMRSAKFGLIASLYNEDLYSSDRIAQVFGVGCAALVPATIGLQKYIPEDAAIYYHDENDLVEKMKAALSSGTYREIAARGRAAYLEAFGSQRVAQYIIDKTIDPSKDLASFDQD
ncbi:MAG: glycosyltransferase family protein [Hyphomicrobiaceae bacterium]